MPAAALAPAPTRFVPPRPEPAPAVLSGFQAAALMRQNGIRLWPAEAYEEPVYARRFFGRSTLLLNAPEAIRHILIEGHENFGRTPATLRVLRPILGDGLFISEGPAWRYQRRTLAPAFAPRSIGLLVPHMESATEEALAELRAGAGQPVDLLAAIQRLTLEIAGRTMFSVEMRERGPALRAMIRRYNRRLGRPHLLDFLLPTGLPAPHDLARALFRRPWRALFDGVLEERRRARTGSGPARDLLDLVIEARDPETGRPFSAGEIRDQAATMIMAGHETTALALFWAVYLLAHRPDLQDGIAAEAAAPAGSGPAAEPGALPLTRAVVEETMRLYPPAYVVVRVVRTPDVVAGAALARGDIVVISPWVLHRHRGLWPDPDAFDPGRFLPGAPPVDRFAYLPFGNGPRVCIGAQFALREAVLVLAKLVAAFRIGLLRPEIVMPIAVVTTQPSHGPPFVLAPRT